MRKYKITARVGLDTFSAIVEAKNAYEANDKALSMGHKLSNYGEERFLQGVTVEPINSKLYSQKKFT